MNGIRRTATALGAVTLLLGAGPGVAGAASAPADRCVKPTRLTVRVNETVRVFTTRMDTDTAYACVRATGTFRKLYNGDGIYSLGRVIALRGRYVAYDTDQVAACKADCPPDVAPRTFGTAVLDVVTGVRRVLARNTAIELRLRPSGTVAYLKELNGPQELWVWDSAGARQVDAGDIRFRSVGLTDTAVRWTNAGVARSAPVG